MTVAPYAQPFFADGTPSESDGRVVGVLLIHGFTGCPASMVPWGRHLAQEGYAVAVPRLPGHGTTLNELNRMRWTDWYDEVERAFDKLSANCDRVVVAGLSMGGCLALRVAEERGNEVAGVVVVNPWLSTTDPRRHLAPVLKRLLPSLSATTNDIKKPGQDEHAYDRVPLKATASVFEMWKRVVPDLPKVTQPLLHFRSTVDHTIDQSSGPLLMSRISSRDTTERTLHDSYHVATLDNDAPQIFSESVDFIRRVTGP